MKRIFAIFAVIALLAVPAGPAFATGDGGDGGGDCNSTNSNAQLLNANVIGNQTQGSCNDSNVSVSVNPLR